MPVTAYGPTMLADYRGVVSLADYANIIGISECGLFGVNPPADGTNQTCRDVWQKWERDQLARYLTEAQREIEDEIGYFLEPRWVVGQLSDEPNGDQRYVDNQAWSRVGEQRTKWSVVIAGGIKAETTIASGETINTATDPGVVGPVATTVTDPDEIRVFHPGNDVEIRPSKITIAAGQVTIEIPRCRTVRETFANNPVDGLAYTTLANFESTVDIKRIYNDTSTNAELVWPHNCTNSCFVNGCSERTQDGCIYVRNNRLGIVDVVPANYSSGTWSRLSLSCCRGAELSRLNYYAGVQPTLQAQDSIIRLAHTKMPKEPCQCDKSGAAWKADNVVPTVLTAERVNCRFGLANGAWIAYNFAQNMKIVRGGGNF